MGDALLLFNISRPQRLTELSNVTQMASRTLAGNSRWTDCARSRRARQDSCRCWLRRCQANSCIEFYARVTHRTQALTVLRRMEVDSRHDSAKHQDANSRKLKIC